VSAASTLAETCCESFPYLSKATTPGAYLEMTNPECFVGEAAWDSGDYCRTAHALEAVVGP
jgi:hypothetical protein